MYINFQHDSKPMFLSKSKKTKKKEIPIKKIYIYLDTSQVVFAALGLRNDIYFSENVELLVEICYF